MLRYSQEEIVKGLEKQGLKFSFLEVSSDGDFLPSDAEWNYKDVPHLNIVHDLVDATYASISDDSIATINLQKIFGFRFPLTVFNYESKPGRQTYFTSFLFYQLIIETWYEPLSPSRTRVNTRYAIGSLPFWQILTPILKWTLKRNYRSLMSSDIPMRARRGELRSWGYSFKGDRTPYSFLETLKIQLSNVIQPSKCDLPEEFSISLDELLEKKNITIGRADHLGLRLDYDAGEIRFFPRMCPHEGANLDKSECSQGQIRCPWHGRKFLPLASIKADTIEAEVLTDDYRINLSGRKIRVLPRL